MKRVEIEWVDSFAHGVRWATQDELSTKDMTMRCTSVGYVFAEDEEAVTIVQSLSFNGDGSIEEYGQPFTIPRVAITKQTQLTRLS